MERLGTIAKSVFCIGVMLMLPQVIVLLNELYRALELIGFLALLGLLCIVTAGAAYVSCLLSAAPTLYPQPPMHSLLHVPTVIPSENSDASNHSA